MTTQKLYSYLRQAIDDYNMIAEGDKLAVGISGGKDSLTLLKGLAGLKRFYPKKFDMVAITVDLGYEDYDVSEIDSFCNELGVEYVVEKTKIKDMIGEGECSLCARLRKGALNESALSMGCNKIVYAHNMDDVIETMMLSLIYEGRFSTFWPVTFLEQSGLTLIRPLIYAPASEIRGYANKNMLPTKKNPCPYDSTTERSYVRKLIEDINKHAPGVKKRMMTAITGGSIEQWKRKDNGLIKIDLSKKE